MRRDIDLYPATGGEIDPFSLSLVYGYASGNTPANARGGRAVRLRLTSRSYIREKKE